MSAALSRRKFIQAVTASLLVLPRKGQTYIETVDGKIPVSQMGTTLIHEHFLVDFIGAEQINNNRWNTDDVVAKVLPYLLEAKKHGVKTILDCTPAYLGRDVKLQKVLAQKSGIQIITNTGYYGAVNNKYLPSFAFTESEREVAGRWIKEYKDGIDETDIKPGFIKIGVDGAHLSTLHQKLVKAAALTHLQTGLTICSHTGIAALALEEIALLEKMKVHPSAFVWTHAQAEKDKSLHIQAASRGAWISLDGIGWGDFENYADSIDNLKQAKLLHKVLISHDAGWYKPGEKDGGSFTGYTNIFTELIPILRKKGFAQKDFDQLLVKNPAEAFGLKQRRL